MLDTPVLAGMERPLARQTQNGDRDVCWSFRGLQGATLPFLPLGLVRVLDDVVLELHLPTPPS